MIHIFADLLLPYITVKNEHECLHCKSEKKNKYQENILQISFNGVCK